MTTLLNNATTIAIVSILISLIIASVIVVVLKNKNKNSTILRTKANLSKASVKLIQSYCSPAEMKFLEILHKALPKDFIAFPYVSLEKLMIPLDNKVDFNIAQSKIVDVCIFLQKTMEPVLAIDLYSPSPLNQSLKKIDEDVILLFKKVKLPFIQILLQEHYELDILKNDLLNAMDDKIFAKIKK